MSMASGQDEAQKSGGTSFFFRPDPKTSPSSPPRNRLLVVDDESAVRALMRHFLGSRGYDVTTVASGLEGIAKLKETQFDLVILDLVMPGMDGLEALEIIRSVHATLPILIYTGTGFDEDILQEARAKGASGFLTKGLPLVNLAAEIRRLLNYHS